MRHNEPLLTLLLALADDELILGHRDAEWTGHAPIIEEDIAFSNIAQDEIGHSLGWFTIYQSLTGEDPNTMAFLREPDEFLCCNFVEMPKGDWAYTIVRQFFFDAAEIIRLELLKQSTHDDIRKLAERVYPEEQYHLLHTEGNVLRLGDATEESHRRMQAAVDAAFGQALGMFEEISDEGELIKQGIFPGNKELENRWIQYVVLILKKSGLNPPVLESNGKYVPKVKPVYGGRKKKHTEHFPALIQDMQLVFRSEPGAKW